MRVCGKEDEETRVERRSYVRNIINLFIVLFIIIYVRYEFFTNRSQWPRGLRRRSAAAWFLGSQVRIPLLAWIFVSCVYMLLSCVGRGLCDGLITHPEESYRVSVCV
jgi:hypothetical protein